MLFALMGEFPFFFYSVCDEYENNFLLVQAVERGWVLTTKKNLYSLLRRKILGWFTLFSHDSYFSGIL